ncbi:MAG: hypothetical protein M3O46_04425, partial [Myxococcota bacterium]|nr:hypothetical protein [Myxococcota bacterium]
MKHCRSFCTSAAAAAWMLLAAPAQATDPTEKDQCIGAADNGQQLRDDGKYKLAQEAFARCARERCPVLVRQDCNQWAQELDEMRPSIVFRAQNANGQDLTDVAVKVDDEPLVSSLDGQALPMDPGEHLFVFEAAGLPPVEQRVVISQGEKK